MIAIRIAGVLAALSLLAVTPASGSGPFPDVIPLPTGF
jgi:hypothetical protein